MIFKVLDKALGNSENMPGLFVLNQAFRLGIPFNIPHAFQLTKLTPSESIVKIPKIKTNTNHLGTIHACAMATAGEFVSGVLLLKNLGATNVRLVLKTLHVDYQRQGTSKLFATAALDSSQLSHWQQELDRNDKIFIDMKAELKDVSGHVASVVTTQWQVKKWSAISSKF